MVEDRTDSTGHLLGSLGIPPTKSNMERIALMGPEIGRSLCALVDDDVVEQVWRRWNPQLSGRLQAPAFRRALKEMLTSGVAMGYSLERFRDVARRLPDPEPAAANWIEPFERVIAARGGPTIRLQLHPADRDAYLSREDEKGEDTWEQMLSMMADGLFYELGVIFPKVEVEADESLDPDCLRVQVNDAVLPVVQGLRADQLLVNDTVDRLTLLNIKGKDAVNPATGSECALIPVAHGDLAESAGLTTWSRQGYAILYLSSILRNSAGGSVSRYLVDHLLEQLSLAFPALIRELDLAVDRDRVVQVLRGLVEEEISIRNLRTILEVMMTRAESIELDFTKYMIFAHNASRYALGVVEDSAVENDILRIRIAMRRYISHKYTRGGNTLVVRLMDPQAERRIAQPLQLSPSERSELIAAVRDELGNLPHTSQFQVILTTSEIRRRLRQEIHPEFPHVAVLSYEELSPDMNIQPIARISPDLRPYGESLHQLPE